MSDTPFTATLIQPFCKSCGEAMWLSRIGPHPNHSMNYELCVFECKQCGEANSRTLDHWTKAEIRPDQWSASA